MDLNSLDIQGPIPPKVISVFDRYDFLEASSHALSGGNGWMSKKPKAQELVVHIKTDPPCFRVLLIQESGPQFEDDTLPPIIMEVKNGSV